MRERELKLLVDPSFELPGLDDAVSGATLGDAEVVQVTDVYHDTVDLRLARSGSTLRHRAGEGWTLKLPRRPTATGLAERDEVRLRGQPDAPPARLLSLASTLTLGEPVVPVAHLETERLVRRWRSEDDEVVAELCDDAVHGTRPDGDDVHFREIEVELAADADLALLRPVRKRLVKAGAMLDPVPKAVRVLGAAALEPPDVRADRLGSDPSAREVIRAAIATSTAQLLRELPAAKLGVDPEGVHQARVASRRLRSDLATFAPLLDNERSEDLSERLRRLTHDLGAVRDCDVLDGKLRALAERHPEIDDAAAAEVVSEVAVHRKRARGRLLRHLRDQRTADLLHDLLAAIDDPPTRKRARRPAHDVMPQLVRKRWQRLHRAIDALGPEPAEAELHDVRIRAKRVRYAAEAVAPAAGKPARRFAKQAARIQDALGELNDAAVGRGWLLGVVDEVSAPAAFAAGQLAQQLLADARVEHARWRDAHDRMNSHTDWLD